MVHLSQAFVALKIRSSCFLLFESNHYLVFFLFCVGVSNTLARLDLIQRRLSDIQIPCLNNGLEITVEKRKQEGSDVRTVNIGVCCNNNSVVAEFCDVEILGNGSSQGNDQGLDLG